jgi:hypothetical protein
VNTVVDGITAAPGKPHCKVTFDTPAPEPTPSYVNEYTAYYEPPVVDLYYYDEPSQNYFTIETPSPQI